jgi:cyclic beta-1,2-glucan synthetase
MSPRRSDNDVQLEKLGRFARAAAKEAVPGRPVCVLNTVKAAGRHLAVIKSVMHVATAYAEAHVSIPQGAEWLLDNWYIAEREGKSAIADLKAAPRLPAVAGFRRQLVVTRAALSLITFGSGRVTAERIETFLDRFQEVVCLSEAELSAFIPALKLSLVDWLADACVRLKKTRRTGRPGGSGRPVRTVLHVAAFCSGFDASEILENVNRSSARSDSIRPASTPAWTSTRAISTGMRSPSRQRKRRDRPRHGREGARAVESRRTPRGLLYFYAASGARQERALGRFIHRFCDPGQPVRGAPHQLRS